MMILDKTLTPQEAMNIILEHADIIEINGNNARLLNVDEAIFPGLILGCCVCAFTKEYIGPIF